MQTTKTLVLSCAGIGSRLGLGKTKALVDICGRTLIAWQLELFKDVEDLRIVIGYQAEDVIKEVTKYRKDVIFVYNHRYFETKTGASFFLGSQYANEYVIEWDGDLVVHPEDAAKCLEYEGEYIAYSDKSSEDGVYVTLNQDGDIISFSKDGGSYEWTGPASIKSKKLKYTEKNVFDQLSTHLPMKGLKIQARDIDTYEDYENVLELVSEWRNA
ncbi:NTP transferase domain-containing protein [Candidatus Woesebacteria bacterium]|nr:NTP transferase domain-containing protein [Candidatus Woesebacteria bacterium]